MAFCPRCRTVVRDGTGKCRACGGPVPTPDPRPWLKWADSERRDDPPDDPEYKMIYPEPKSIVVVVVLNLFLPGLGQKYLGQSGKALLILLPTVLSIFLGMAIEDGDYIGIRGTGATIMAVAVLVAAVLVWIIRIAAIVDGVLIANKMNQDKMVGRWEWF